jgi:hypothetical protein
MSVKGRQQTSLHCCLPHHTFDIGRFSLGISLAICPMFGDESSFETLVSLGFLRMSPQIVPERQPLLHLSMWFCEVHMMGALCAKGRHPFNEEHPILLRIVGPIDVAKASKRFDDVRLRDSQ